VGAMLQIPDLINGSFEALGGVLLTLNIKRLYADKKVAGINPASTVFFTGWGLWNLYYYPQLGQICSFLGGCLIVAANATWLLLAGYYHFTNKGK
jgi:hypothetical protein